MKKTTIQVSEHARGVLAIIKYQLDCKDYSETIIRIRDILLKIDSADKLQKELHTPEQSGVDAFNQSFN